MSVIQIHSKEFEEMLALGQEQKIAGGNHSQFQNSGLGTFSAKSSIFPYIYTVDHFWNTANDIIVHEPEDFGQTIDFSFQLEGKMTSTFNGIKQNTIMSDCHHNFKFTPGKNHQHKFAKNQNLNIFHVSIERNFFIRLIGCEDRWSESILKKLEKHEPFIGTNASLKITPLIRHLIESLKTYQGEGTIGHLRWQSLLFELLAVQLEQCKQTDMKNPSGDLSADDKVKLYALHSYLQEHFLEDLTLDGLCRISTLNEFKLKKGFKLLFNTSVFAYVKQLRMEYAIRLIRDNRKKVEEVAEILGYEYSNHFSAAFKKYYGYNPSILYN